MKTWHWPLKGTTPTEALCLPLAGPATQAVLEGMA